jgi:AcrR family transcriptional regulator
MGRKSLKETRQKEIVKAFYTVAKREGLENTSIAKVADYMSINPSLVIHYFKSKQGLEVALADYILERYLQIYKSNGTIDSEEKMLVLIEKLFSRKWNRLFDDGVFYSCYAHVYRNKEFRNKFKQLHDSLRSILKQSLVEAAQNMVIEIENVDKLTETIFALLEGAYYYLGLVDDKKENNLKVHYYKQHVIEILQFRKHPVSPA